MSKWGQKDYKESEITPYQMDKELQRLIDERQRLIDQLCMEIIAVEEGMTKVLRK